MIAATTTAPVMINTTPIREGKDPSIVILLMNSLSHTLVMLPLTPERKVPGSLKETGPELQLTEEDWIPYQLSILNMTISLQMILRLPSLEQAILLMNIQ